MKKKIKKLAVKHEKRRKELVNKIKLCQEHKKRVIIFANHIRHKHKKGHISKVEYKHKIYSMLKGMEPEHWIEYYDNYIEACKKEINKISIEAGIWLKNLSIVIILLMLMFVLTFFTDSLLPTGLTVWEDAEVFAGKDVYEVGEMAHLFIVPSYVDYEIEVYDPNGNLYANALNFPVEKIGTYTVTAFLSYGNETTTVSTSFDVAEINESINATIEEITGGIVEDVAINETEPIINFTITKLRPNITNATVNGIGESENKTETAPAAEVSTPINITLDISKAAGAISFEPDVEFEQSDIIEEVEKDENNKAVSVLKMNKGRVKIKIKGAKKEKIKDVWFRNGVLHVDSVDIKDAAIGIPHPPLRGVTTRPNLYIKEDYETDFRLAVPYEKNNKTFNKVRVTSTHYEFDVEHFSEFNLTGGTNYTTLTQALFWQNGTDDMTLVVSQNDTYFNDSDYSEMNGSLFNTTGLILGYNFETDDEVSNVTDYTNNQNGTITSTGVDWVTRSDIMKRAIRINETTNALIDSEQNIGAISKGNWSFLMGGLILYQNMTPLYTTVSTIMGQINPATFAGALLLVSHTNKNYSLTYANIAAGGAAQGPSITMRYGVEYCIGGYIRTDDDTNWNISLYIISKEGEESSNDDSGNTADPTSTENFYIGEVPSVVTVTPNMTIGSVAIYNESRNMQLDDIRDFCYGRLERYYGYGEHQDGRVKITAYKNVTIAQYNIDSNNDTAFERYGFFADAGSLSGKINMSNIRLENITVRGFDIQAYFKGFWAILGGDRNLIRDSYIRGNFFDNARYNNISVYATQAWNFTVENSLFNHTTGISLVASGIANRNTTLRSNTFQDINYSVYNTGSPFGALVAGTGAELDIHVYNNYFYDIVNGSAIYVGTNQWANITNNTINNASIVDSDGELYGAMYFRKGSNVSLNNFYGTGINITESVNATFCVNGQGNFYRETINASWIPSTDCGQANLTRPALNTNYSALLNATWNNQSSANNISYYLYYSNDTGASWYDIARVYGDNFYNWSIANMTYNTSYAFKIIPFDDNYNATHRNITVFGIENAAPTVSSVLLNATSLNNLTVDNLTANPSGVTDPNAESVTFNYNWYKNGVSDTVLNMPFTKPDSTNRTYDFSGYDNHGNVTTVSNWNKTAGYDGFGAYEFDGANDYVLIDDDGNRFGKTVCNNGCTFCAWIKHNLAAVPSTQVFLARQDGTDNNRFFFLGYTNAEKPQFFVYANGASTPNSGVTGSVVVTTAWHHICGTYNGSTTTDGYSTLYVDGVSDGVGSAMTIGDWSDNEDVFIGIGDDGGFTWDWNGVIDEVVIWNRSLSANEIALLYDNKTNTTHFDATSAGENWTVKVTPIDSEGLNGNGVFSNSLNVTQMFLSVYNQTPKNVTSQGVNDTAPVNPNQNLTIRVNVSAVGGGLDTVWIDVWRTVKSAGSGIFHGVMSLIKGFWQTIIPVTDDYPKGVVNYTVYANFTGGNVTEIEGNFSVNNYPSISSTVLNASSPNNLTFDNLTASTVATDADSHSIQLNYNWYLNGSSDTVLNMPFTAPDNNDATYDFSGYGNDGTLIGPEWNKTGGYDGFGAYEFDGVDDYVRTSNNKILGDSTTEASFSAWFKFNSLTPSTQNIVDDGRRHQFKKSTNNNIYGYMDGSSVSNNQVISTTAIIVDTWYHVAITNNGTWTFLYFNGILEDDIQETYVTSYAGRPISLGTDYLDTSFFNGTIDDVRIYNRALSADEISLLYSNQTNKTHFDATTRGDNWTVKVTPIDEYGLNGTELFANDINITNTPPPNVTLVHPAKNNLTTFNITPTFNWTAVTDDDGDSVTYTINITHATCSDILVGGLTVTGYSVTQNLCLDGVYNWTVYASDGITNSTGRNVWGFTVASRLIMTLTNKTVNFSEVIIANEYNTSYDGAPDPIVIQNDGNVEADVVGISANKSLWTSVGLATSYFQFKANNRTTEEGAFNWSGSTTTWTNFQNASVENTTVISQLNWTDNNDTADIDIRILVPSDESSGAKYTNIIIRGATS